MTKQKSTKRALLMSALSLLMCVSMLIGSTFAWFTDFVVSGNNKIVAGNLDVALYHTNGSDTDEEVTDTTKLFDEVTLWEPGAMVWEKLTVKNLGSLALKYTLSVNVSDISVVDGKSLADVLKVAVMTEQPTRDNIKTATAQDLKTFALKGEAVLAAQTGVDTFYVAIYWEPTANDNDYNLAGEQLYATLGVNLLATQATVEKDSFDEQYDVDASFDDVIFANGGTYVMDADRNEGITISSGATVVINGEGNAINNGAAGLINEGNATVNNVVMNAGSASNYSNITRGADAKTTYNDVTLNSAGGGVGATNGAEVIFNSGSVEVNTTSTSGRYLFYAEGEGTVITINGGDFADFTKTSQNQKRAYIYAGAGTTVYVNGGTFGKASTRSGYTAGILGEGTVVITGGTFGFDPSNWVDAGYQAVKNGTNWYVVPENVSNLVANATQLQNALDSATDGSVIYVIGDITGDVTATQKPDVKVTIEGNGNTFAGVLLVDGKSGTYTTAGITVKDFVFKADSISADACIQLGNGTNATRYTCNVTVSGCTFDVPGAVGVKSYTGGDKNLTITDCVATAAAHSLVQAKGIDGILVEKCIVNSKNGLNFNNSTNVVIDTCNVDVKGYAVRFGESSGGTGAAEAYSIKNCTLKSACDDGDAVIVLRGTADNSTLTIENTTIEGAIEITNTATGATVVR